MSPCPETTWTVWEERLCDEEIMNITKFVETVAIIVCLIVVEVLADVVVSLASAIAADPKPRAGCVWALPGLLSPGPRRTRFLIGRPYLRSEHKNR